jgi:hypothetical protein
MPCAVRPKSASRCRRSTVPAVIDRVNEQRRLALVCLFDQQQVFFVDGGSGGCQAIEAHNVDTAIGIAPEREFHEGNETGKCSHGGNLLLLDGQLFCTSSRERDSDKSRRELPLGGIQP